MGSVPLSLEFEFSPSVDLGGKVDGHNCPASINRGSFLHLLCFQKCYRIREGIRSALYLLSRLFTLHESEEFCLIALEKTTPLASNLLSFCLWFDCALKSRRDGLISVVSWEGPLCRIKH